MAGLDSYQYVIVKKKSNNVVYSEKIKFDETTSQTTAQVTIPVTDFGSNYIYVKAFDRAGNEATECFGN